MNPIDITPTWRQFMPALMTLAGSDATRDGVASDLLRLAQIADAVPGLVLALSHAKLIVERSYDGPGLEAALAMYDDALAQLPTHVEPLPEPDQRQLPDPAERLATDIEHGGEYEGVETIVINGRRMKHPAPASEGWIPLPIETPIEERFAILNGKEWKIVQGQFFYRTKPEGVLFSPHHRLKCGHNEMVRADVPGHAWKCAKCGYLYQSA